MFGLLVSVPLIIDWVFFDQSVGLSVGLGRSVIGMVGQSASFGRSMVLFRSASRSLSVGQWVGRFRSVSRFFWSVTRPLSICRSGSLSLSVGLAQSVGRSLGRSVIRSIGSIGRSLSVSLSQFISRSVRSVCLSWSASLNLSVGQSIFRGRSVWADPGWSVYW